MEFFRRAEGAARQLAVLPGTFNPPTLAHLALADAALTVTGEVLFVLPRAFPHKPYEGASFDERVEMLGAALADRPRCSIAASDGGLFIDIARECRRVYRGGVELYFVCGRDAAERIVGGDYGARESIHEQFREYRLLVAPREGRYQPPAGLEGFIQPLEGPAECDEISASIVRERIARGEPWRHLVPETIADLVERIYSQL